MAYIESFWVYLKISSPYLLLGFFVAGLIRSFVSIVWIQNTLGHKSKWGFVKATLFGIPFPLCSCAVVPTAITLKKSGANNASTSSFLIATPETGVDSIAMTYGVMDLPMTILRPVFAFFSAAAAGVLQLIFNKEEVEIQEEVKSCCGSKKAQTQKPFSKRLNEGLNFAFGKLINDVSLWLLFGLCLGALINLIVPSNFFENLSGFQSRFMILLIGIPLYICASASTPIAASLMLKGLSPGAALLFLMVGPATNASNMALIAKYIRKRGVILNVIAISVVGLGASYFVDYLYNIYNWPKTFAIEAIHDHEHESWRDTASAIVMGLLLLKGVWFEEIKPRFIQKG